MNYSQANIKGKKEEMAGKMYRQHGRKPSGTTMDAHGDGGMKYKENGGPGLKSGGMKYEMNGKDTGYAKGMKYFQSNKKHTFSNNYTQNGKGQ